jgi:hypothetical protein
MINLIDLSREERTLITIQCESFCLSDRNQVKNLNNVHRELLKLFTKKYEKELWTFLSACGKAMRYGTLGSLFTLRNADYATINKANPNSKVSYRKTIALIEMLHKQGYIIVYKGFYDHTTDTSIKSCFLMQPSLLHMFEGINFGSFAAKRNPMDMIEIRDMESKVVISDLSKLRGIKKKRELVCKYNDNLQNFDIRCKGRKTVAVYKRVFTDDLGKAGRWYSFNGLQTAPKTLRPDITINGVKTTEIDFKQMHPRLLLCLEGVKRSYDFEPYKVPKGTVKTLEGDYDKIIRKLCKKTLLCVLYAKSSEGAAKAVMFDYSKNKHLYKGVVMEGLSDFRKLVKALEDTNHNISHWFYTKGLWAKLQGYDAEITAKIIEKFIDLGECILPWHDSYVVEKHLTQTLIDVMMSSWKDVMGTSNNCYYDIEF